MVSNSVQTVVLVLILIAVGYALYKAKWIEAPHIPVLTRLIINIAVPCVTFVNMFSYMTPQMLSESGAAIFVSLSGILLGMAFGAAGCAIFKIPQTRRGLVIGMSGLSNSLFIGLPVCIGIYGSAAMPYVLYYYIANTTCLWTFGVYFIQKDASSGKLRLFSSSALKKLLTAPLIAFFACILLLIADFHPPQLMLKACEYLGGMMTPLSLILIGVIIARSGIRQSLRLEKGMGMILAGHCIIMPVFSFLATPLFGVSRLGVQALTIMAAMPTMSQSVLLSEKYGADVGFAAKNTVLSTLISLVTLPLFASIMPSLF